MKSNRPSQRLRTPLLPSELLHIHQLHAWDSLSIHPCGHSLMQPASLMSRQRLQRTRSLRPSWPASIVSIIAFDQIGCPWWTFLPAARLSYATYCQRMSTSHPLVRMCTNCSCRSSSQQTRSQWTVTVLKHGTESGEWMSVLRCSAKALRNRDCGHSLTSPIGHQHYLRPRHLLSRCCRHRR